MGVGRIVTLTGRYFAMDRDKRWERTEAAYEAIVQAKGREFSSALARIETWHREDVTDEFISPSLIVPPGAQPTPSVRKTRRSSSTPAPIAVASSPSALANPDFTGFERTVDLSASLELLTMTHYMDDLRATEIFGEKDIDLPLARVISDAGLTQLHAAETEKYAHVTFFFNGGTGSPFAGEERALVPSPKVRPTIFSPKCAHTRRCGRCRGHRIQVLSIHRCELCQRRYGRTHRRDPRCDRS